MPEPLITNDCYLQKYIFKWKPRDMKNQNKSLPKAHFPTDKIIKRLNV